MADKQNPTLIVTRGELNTILEWYETLRDERGNEPQDDALFQKLSDAYDAM